MLLLNAAYDELRCVQLRCAVLDLHVAEYVELIGTAWRCIAQHIRCSIYALRRAAQHAAALCATALHCLDLLFVGNE